MMNRQDVNYKTVKFFSNLAKKLKPLEPLTVSEWANKYMVLPKGDAREGRYSTKNAPYQKEIMDAITRPEVVDVTVMSSAQVGKSLIMKCGIAYYIDYEPATQIIVLPTIELGERFSKTSLAPMISDVPRLREKVAKTKERDSNNTIRTKSYPGGDLIIAGANAPASLAQAPRRIVWMDEIDRFPASAGDEGNPVLLAEKRATSYWNKKHIKTSTPTIKGFSKIEDAYLEGSMEEWCVACPECGEYQPYDFKRIDFKTTNMICEKCGCMSSEMAWKKSKHKWIAKHPERVTNRSFHLNELASPFSDWKNIIETFEKAMRRLEKYHDPKDLKVFINTVLGETWDIAEMDTEKVDDDTLKSRAEHYDAEIPEGVLILTAAVDVQDDRFEIEIRGWARNYETWGIYKTEIHGNLYTNEPWDRLEEYLDQAFEFKDGHQLNIAGFAIDSGGHFTNSVYKWSMAMRKKKKRCYAVKGYAGKQDIPLLYKKSVGEIKEDVRGKKVTVARTLLYILGVDAGKEDISNRLKIEKPGEGYCHFPADEGRGYDEEYYKGLTSEHKIVEQKDGKIVISWQKEGGRRNEPFDLLNYNYAVLEILKPKWDVLEQKIKTGVNYMRTSGKKRDKRRSINGIEV